MINIADVDENEILMKHDNEFTRIKYMCAFFLFI